MPYTKPDGSRDYKREYAKYASKPEQIKNRSERSVARVQANASGRTHKGDHNDIDHIKPLSKGGSTAKSNTRVVPESVNRSFSRNPDSSVKKNSPKKK